MQSKYPSEAPVFEVKSGHGFSEPGTDAGSIVIGVDFHDENRGILACHAPHHADPLAERNGGDERWGWWYFPDELKPLTDAAREMLAVVRGAK